MTKQWSLRCPAVGQTRFLQANWAPGSETSFWDVVSAGPQCRIYSHNFIKQCDIAKSHSLKSNNLVIQTCLYNYICNICVRVCVCKDMYIINKYIYIINLYFYIYFQILTYSLYLYICIYLHIYIFIYCYIFFACFP